MSDAIDSLRILHNNPFIFSSGILNFFKNLKKKEHSLLLAYLVLPLALPESRRTYLKSAKPASNLRTMVAKKDRLGNLQELISDYKSVTNATLQYLISAGCIQLQEDQVHYITSLSGLDAPSPDGLDAATGTLARFFLPYDVSTIYRMVGVWSL